MRIDLPEYAPHPVMAIKDVLNGPFVKFLDFHDNSVIAKKIMLHENVIAFLEAALGDKVIGMQSLIFKYGSQQATH